MKYEIVNQGFAKKAVIVLGTAYTVVGITLFGLYHKMTNNDAELIVRVTDAIQYIG